MSNRHERRKAAARRRVKLAPNLMGDAGCKPAGYAARVIAEGLRLRAANPGGGVYLASVEHEPWCARPAGGPCTCEPDVSVKLWGASDA